MDVLTIYTKKFDSCENVYGGGMSGKVFLESWNGNQDGGAGFNSLDEALDYCENNGKKPDRIDIHYLGEGGIQRFWKFNVQEQ